MLLKPRTVARAVFYGGLLTAIATACSKTNSSDDEAAAVSPDVSVATPELGDGKAKLTFKSSGADVHYECRVDVEDQKGEYEACDESGLEVKTRAGVSYKVYIKAISKNGLESRPAVRSFVGPGAIAPPAPGPNPGPAPQEQQPAVDIATLRTQILNPGEFGRLDPSTHVLIVSGSRLTLQFGIEGDRIPAAELRFECRIGDEPRFKDCNGSSYSFEGLSYGPTYLISVRAIHRISGRIAMEDALSIKASLPPVVVDSGVPPPPPVSGPVHPWGFEMALGSGFEVAVTPDLHVTEYSTSKTGGPLSFFRVKAGDGLGMDPLYLGNEACFDRDEDRVSRRNTSGKVYSYCHATPLREAYKARNDFRLALNHIEVASEMQPVITANGQELTPPGYERIAISVFDADFELMNSHSRFWNLCANSAWRKSVYQVPMLSSYFEWEMPANVDFFTCETVIGNAVTGQSENWRVGAFFAIKGGAMDFGCGCSHPEAVEMVYMSRTAGELEYQFVKNAQRRILGTPGNPGMLRRSQPN